MTYRALVIDDNWHNRNIFKISLEFAGYETTLAESAMQGFSYLESSSFDLLVLDLHMPKISGEEVLEWIHERPELASMVILVVTANPARTPRVEDQADYIMQKPINIKDFSQFVTRMQRAIDRKQEATSEV